jgi:protein-tyrosine phosphatase
VADESVSGATPPEDVFAILFVCTGNICRSAFAERFGQAYLQEEAGDDAGVIWLSSAGIAAVEGSGMHPDSALVLAGFGAEPGDFTAAQFEPETAADADLILTMTRSHRRRVLRLAPDARDRTFTLREAAELLELPGAVAVEGADLPERARALVRNMATARRRRQGGPTDDIPDPIGLPVEGHQAAGELIVQALVPILHRILMLGDGQTARRPDALGADGQPPLAPPEAQQGGSL